MRVGMVVLVVLAAVVCGGVWCGGEDSTSVERPLSSPHHHSVAPSKERTYVPCASVSFLPKSVVARHLKSSPVPLVLLRWRDRQQWIYFAHGFCPSHGGGGSCRIELRMASREGMPGNSGDAPKLEPSCGLGPKLVRLPKLPMGGLMAGTWLPCSMFDLRARRASLDD